MSKTTTKTRAEQIAELNDQFRRSLGLGGQLMLTPGISSLEPLTMLAVLEKVRNQSVFTFDDDPHGEHDFGAFNLKGVRGFWKIDYYSDRTFTAGAEDPANPIGTIRVLTVMLASEY